MNSLLVASVVIPPMDPFGIPAPPSLFLALILFTMLLHVLFMNYVLGGIILASVLDAATLLRLGDFNHTVRILWQVMPVALSLTITTGVAPLLFVQVLYGHFFLTAGVFMGHTWLALVPILLVGFYVIYFISLRLGNALRNRVGAWDFKPGRRLLATFLAAALIGAVAWILSNNHMLSIQSREWPLDGQWKQTRLVVSPALTVPRLAHFTAGAVGVAGLWLAWIAWWRAARSTDNPAQAASIARTGLNALFTMQLFALVGGPAFLSLLPPDVRAELLTPRSALSILWLLSLAAFVAQVVLTWFARKSPLNPVPLAALTSSVLLTLVGMIAGREQVRLAYLRAPHVGFSLDQWSVRTQVGSLVLFFCTLLLGIATIVWLLRCVVRTRPLPPSSADELRT